MSAFNYALKVAYDGTSFWGWQKNNHGPSIEENLQLILEKILQLPISLQAASRTDRGVHAEGQWVNFFCKKGIKPESLLKSLNALLPPTIRILAVQEVPFFFHPTLHAVKKEYQYKICLNSIQLPQERFFSWHAPFPLNLTNIEKSLYFFLGNHDFSSFCNFRKHLNYHNKDRHIESLSFVPLKDDYLLFSIIGNSFLYKMVRTIIGTLMYVGQGKIHPESIPFILANKQRACAGITAPAHGLTLKKIYYPQEFGLDL